MIKHNSTASRYNIISVFNIFLLAAVIFLMMYFVILSNIVTASNYKIGLSSEKLSGLLETNGLLTARKLLIEDSSAVYDFAVSHHMVESGHSIHVFEGSDVAALR